jgi:lactate racemase
MRVRLDYGDDGLEVDLPDDRSTVIEPLFRPSVSDPHASLVAALRAPLDAPPLREVTRRGGRVAISVCDITCAQPLVGAARPKEMQR